MLPKFSDVDLYQSLFPEVDGLAPDDVNMPGESSGLQTSSEEADKQDTDSTALQADNKTVRKLASLYSGVYENRSNLRVLISNFRYRYGIEMKLCNPYLSHPMCM